MAHQVENMIFRGATPWHGLGERFTDRLTFDAALERANLNRPRELVQLRLPDGTPVEQYAVTRLDDGQIHGFVGGDYRVFSDAEILGPMVRPFVDAGLADIETAGSLKNGARTWMLAKINRPDAVIVPQADDVVAKYLMVAHGYDGWFGIHCGITGIRTVCWNTLMLAIQESNRAMLRFKHTAGAGAAVASAAEIIELADRDFEKSAEIFRALAGVRVRGAAQLRAYVDAVFPSRSRKVKPLPGETLAPAPESDASRKIFDDVERLFVSGRGNDRPGVRGTAWAAYNAVTEYLTWERGRTNDSRMDTVWFRQKNGAPEAALTEARETFLVAA